VSWFIFPINMAGYQKSLDCFYWISVGK
jgi:hypothetical protein